MRQEDDSFKKYKERNFKKGNILFSSPWCLTKTDCHLIYTERLENLRSTVINLRTI